jgi:hypothetical protein
VVSVVVAIVDFVSGVSIVVVDNVVVVVVVGSVVVVA